MLDIGTLTKITMEFLTPALPYLMKVGDKAIDGAIGKIGEDSRKTVRYYCRCVG